MIIVGVSGGVDSVVLLDKISRNLKPSDIVVAHVDHGVRSSSSKDAEFVRKLCEKHKVVFELKTIDLSDSFSEDQGRIERYKFFEEMKQKYDALYIVTAHHKDDLIETAIINILRGTGRRGLSSLKSTETIKRPLLSFSKGELIEYAQDNDLAWVEDDTNKDTKYLRNKVRLDFIPKLKRADPNFYDKFLKIINAQKDLNREIDNLIARVLERNWPQNEGNKTLLKSYDEQILKELILTKARNEFGEYYISKERLEAAAEFIKTNSTGKQLELNGRLSLFIEKSVITIKSTI